jgi:hypothetical protein
MKRLSLGPRDPAQKATARTSAHVSEHCAEVHSLHNELRVASEIIIRAQWLRTETDPSGVRALFVQCFIYLLVVCYTSYITMTSML